MSAKRLTLSIVSFSILTGNMAFADWKENAKAIKVSGGEDHTLVLTENKFVWSCGPNGAYTFGQYRYGVLGTGNNIWDHTEETLLRVHDGNMITASGYLEEIIDVSAGWLHSLALDVNGLVWSWGWNSEGQLGDGSQEPHSVPVQVHDGDMSTPSGYLEDIISISAGRSGEHSLAVDVNNLVYAWGMNQEGQLGDANHGQGVRKLTPVKVKGVNGQGYLQNIIVVSGGADHSMALEELDPFDPNRKGRVYTWGSNKWPGDGESYQSGRGKLGNGSIVDLSDTPIRVLAGQQDPNDQNAFLKNIVAISAGWNHCMALEKDDPFEPNYKGRVYTWGSNGQGYGNYQDPCSIGGRLGNGTYVDSNTPVLVLAGEQNPNDPNSHLKHIVAIAAGEAHSMAVDANGYVYTWGDNYHGQLGNGTNDPCTRPVKVVGRFGEGYLKNIVSISAGYWHCLAIDANGTIWVWGKHKKGRLGLGDGLDWLEEYTINTPHPVGVVYNNTHDTFRFGLQDAIDDANSNDELEASRATYYETIDFPSKSLTLKSSDPNDWDVVGKTIIDGLNLYYNYDLITLNSNPGSTIAGFTLTNAYHRGMSCTQSSINIKNCIVQNNGYDGIYGYGTPSTTITNSTIRGNGGNGIYAYNSGLVVDHSLIVNNGSSGLNMSSSCTLVLQNSIIRCNGLDGVTLDNNHATTIKNNWIHNNGTKHQEEAAGIWFGNQVSVPLVRNNTIYANYTHGIEASQQGADPNILNCIIYSNGSGDFWKENGTFNTVNYCCLQNTHSGTGNITGDPLFYDDPNDPNNFHLSSTSPCIDKGNPYADYSDETDIDGEDRVVDGDSNGTQIVDMGADEFYWSPADFNGDEIVNFFDYARFANAWQSHPGDPNWNPDCDIGIPDNNHIDYNDLSLFCKDWLWKAGWDKPAGFMMMGRSAGETETVAFTASEISLQSISAEQQIEKVAPLKIEQLIKWLEQVWLEEETQKLIDKDLWLKFMESLKEEL